jgi:hypothetical protein
MPKYNSYYLKGDTAAIILDGVKIVQKKVNNGVLKTRPKILKLHNCDYFSLVLQK